MNKNLNRDDHQFHQYQQNEQSLLILTELTEYQKPPNDASIYKRNFG